MDMNLMKPTHLTILLGLLAMAAPHVCDAQHGVGPNWGPEVLVSTPGTDSSPGVGRMIAVDSSGVAHVVWQVPSAGEIHYTSSADSGKTWTAPQLVAGGTYGAADANLAVDSGYRAHIAYLGEVPGGGVRILYTRSTPVGGFDVPRDLSGVTPLSPEAPAISIDLQDRVHVAWHIGDPSSPPTTAADAAKVYYTRSEDAGENFSAPSLISDITGKHAAWPRFSVSWTDGDVLALCWRDNRVAPDWDIYVAVSDDGGGAFINYAAAATSNKEWDPEVIVDGNDVLHLTYTLQDVGFIGTIAYRRSIDRGGTWSSEEVLSDEVSFFSWLGYDPYWDAIWILWKDQRDFDPTDLRGDLILRYSVDGGLNWSFPEFATDLGGDLETRFPSLAVGPDGAPWVIWGDYRASSTQSSVFVKRRSSPLTAAVPPRPPISRRRKLVANPNPSRFGVSLYVEP
jgi:hypothetical protein